MPKKPNTLRKPRAITERQKEVLAHIVKHMEDYGHPPTRDELADLMGLAANFSVQEHIDRLVFKGYLTRMKGVARGLYLTEKTADLFDGNVQPKSPAAKIKCISPKDKVVLDAYLGLSPNQKLSVSEEIMRLAS